jgi:two-component system, response regulator PdtaR
MSERPVVLVVDDDVLVRLMISDAFNDAGYQALEAASAGDAAMVLAARSDIAAVVSDIEMPGPTNGIDLAWTVAQASPAIVTVLLSGRAHPSPDTLPQGAVFRMKPIGIPALVEEVTKKIAKAAARQIGLRVAAPVRQTTPLHHDKTEPDSQPDPAKD